MNKHGIGLGLIITKKLIQQLGPRNQAIQLESAPGKGTKISFLIYRKMATESKVVNRGDTFKDAGKVKKSQMPADLAHSVDESKQLPPI